MIEGDLRVAEAAVNYRKISKKASRMLFQVVATVLRTELELVVSIGLP